MQNVENLTINTIRLLSAEGVQKAKSGHPGMPMGTAPLAYTLWSRHMKHNPANPAWLNRDRFILSAGHGSMLIYSLLHLFGYGLEIEDLKNFRQYGSKTPGHPEYGHVVGVETTTGPLGQGFANGVGMAIAESYLAAKFNKPGYNLVDHYAYVVCGDGCMMEGITSEAASLAGTLALNKLIVLYDSNSITIEGSTDIAFREDVGKRFEAYGWNVLKVSDGNDINAIDKALSQAKNQDKKPTLIIVNTIIGFGCPDKQGKASSHGEPLGEENIACTKRNLGWNYEEPFYVPDEVKEHLNSVKQKLASYESEWNKIFNSYVKEYPELAAEWSKWQSGTIPEEMMNDESLWAYDGKPNATRSISNDIENKVFKYVPNMMGGSADLAPSNKTLLKGAGDYSAETRNGTNMHFGVREHAMGSIANGMAVHGGLIPYVSTFFVFSDYMRGAMRLSAIMGLPVIYVLTHDSIGVGEDGPTHQPVEHLAALRCIPGFTVIRPADTKETAAAWISALNNKKGPTALVLTRQNLPAFNETGKGALKGAYIVLDSEKSSPDIILMASGSELRLVYEAHARLKEKGIDARVVSMPSLELFDRQPEEYRESILPKKVRARLAVEAASSFGWHKYTGSDGLVISIDTFGTSGTFEKLFEVYGFTVNNVVENAMSLLK